jgi:hypothetical protein
MPSRVDRENSSSLDNYEKEPYSYTRQQQPAASLRYNPWEFENPWSHGLCNITEQCDETCYGFWCLPCFSSHLAWRMNESCWITCCVPGSLAILRTKMRTAFRIEVLNYFTKFITYIFVFFRVRILLIFVLLNVVHYVQHYKWPVNYVSVE